MISEEIFKRTAAVIGLPAAVIIAVIIVLDFGLSPIDTAAVKAAKTADEVAHILGQEHQQQMASLMNQTRDLQIISQRNLDALKEICFNTALNQEGRRRCGAL